MPTIDYYFELSGLPIEDLAERSGLTLARLEAIVTGRWTPSPQERAKVAAGLGCSVDDISWGHSMDPRNIRYRRFGMRGDA